MYFFIYSIGMFCMSVCVSSDMSKEEIEKRANAENPLLGGMRWSISKDDHFAKGESMPCQCEKSTERKHWLLEC